MELFYFKCPLCGYMHQVPAYWLSFEAPESVEAPHCDNKTGELCENLECIYVAEQ